MDMNLHPSLHSKVLDSLIMHVKEAHYLAGSTQAKEQSGKTGASSNFKNISAETQNPWAKLALELNTLGLQKTTSDALISWAKWHSDEMRNLPTRLRVLHPMEREFISPEAYGYLLELHYLRLLSPDQVEQIIEHCAMLTSLPARVEQLQRLVMKLFSEQVDAAGMNLSN